MKKYTRKTIYLRPLNDIPSHYISCTIEDNKLIFRDSYNYGDNTVHRPGRKVTIVTTLEPEIVHNIFTMLNIKDMFKALKKNNIDYFINNFKGE